MKALKAKGLSNQQISQFALAEFSSAVEMLHAAKLVNNSRLAAGFINHALDEYKHTNFFLRLLSKSASTDARFDPRQTISGGFVKPDNFLFERMDLIEFAAFIAVNEANALRIFTSIKERIDKIDMETINQLDEIIEEEKIHLDSMSNSRQKNGSIESGIYRELLADEERHVAFSSKFLENSKLRARVNYAKTKSQVGNKLRHFWASQHKIQGVVDKLVSGLTITLLRPFKRALILPDSNNNDFFSTKTYRNML